MPKGFMSSFARFFGIGKKGESTDMTGNEETGSSTTGLSQKMSNHLMNEQLAGLSAGGVQVEQPGDDTVEGTQAKGSIAREDSIEALYNKLKASKRGGVHLLSGNSSFYNKVMDSMNGIMDIMKQKFSQDTRSNLNQFDSIQVEYQELINACEAYLNRTTLTDKGQIRQEIVKNILQTAQRDLIGLSGVSMEFATFSPEKQEKQEWPKILEKARVTHLSISNLFGGGREKEGAASEVIKIKPDMVRIRKEDGTEEPLSGNYYFKPEEEIEVEAITYASKIVNSVIARYPGVSQTDKELLQSWAAKQCYAGGTIGFADNPQGLSEQGQLALETIKMKTPGTINTYDELLEPSGIASEGGKINMTKRNVATSRMAALLGLEHLVAKSYTAELFDEATGQTFRGNMIEQAKGTSLKDFSAQRLNTPPAINNLVQRDVLNLQVLDVLCGQMDRHYENIFLQTEGDTITGIMGIDNDGAFGLNTDVVTRKSKNRHDRRVFDPETEELVLPYMDKNLAHRIAVLDPRTVQLSLKGLITDREIEAALQRLAMMKNAIKKTSGDRLLEDNQWNQQTAQTVLKRGWDYSFDDMMEGIVDKICELEPRFKGIPLSKISESQEDYMLFKSLENQVRDILRDKAIEEKVNKQNYLSAIIQTFMDLDRRKGDVPQIEIKNLYV